MKQKRYRMATVGTTIKSIFSLSFASALGSKVTKEWPYLDDLVRKHALYLTATMKRL